LMLAYKPFGFFDMINRRKQSLPQYRAMSHECLW
jgi:hypothetical protein